MFSVPFDEIGAILDRGAPARQPWTPHPRSAYQRIGLLNAARSATCLAISPGLPDSTARAGSVRGVHSVTCATGAGP
jgi:hypothetical protein